MAIDEAIPHDQLFKTLFRSFLADLVALLDPALGDLLDLDAPTFLEKEAFTDLAGGERAELDLVAKAKTRLGEPRIVLVHIEIERTFRTAMDDRMWRYAMHLEPKYRRPVLPAVVYLRGGPAGVERREVVRTVGAFEVHRFGYLAFGLSRSRAEVYLAKPQPLAPALAALMQRGDRNKVEHKLECLKAIGQTELDDARRFLLTNVVGTYLRLDLEEQERFAAEIARKANREVQEMIITWEDALEAKAKGIAEGEARGEAKGKLDATREAILLLLRHRFGESLGDFESRLERIDDLGRLHEMLERAIKATSLADVEV